MSKKIGIYFLLLSFLGQSMLANALPVFTTVNDISASTNILSSIPTPTPINESPCHEESHEESHEEKASSTFVNNIEVSSNLNLSINSDLENSEKHQHCKKNCHCPINLYSHVFSAVLFTGFETYAFAGKPEFLANFSSVHPIKIPSSVLRPPSLS